VKAAGGGAAEAERAAIAIVTKKPLSVAGWKSNEPPAPN
jgi:hypothetical protein